MKKSYLETRSRRVNIRPNDIQQNEVFFLFCHNFSLSVQVEKSEPLILGLGVESSTSALQGCNHLIFNFFELIEFLREGGTYKHICR
jgi:hypothetical protein